MMYKVKFTESGFCKMLPMKLIAYGKPAATAYYFTTRVVACYKSDKMCDGAMKRFDGYFVGIVGEPAKCANNFRYLIFFDAGFAQYVNHEEVFPVTKITSTTNVVEDVDIHSRAFICQYIKSYPELPMVRLQVGQSTQIQMGNRW